MNYKQKIEELRQKGIFTEEQAEKLKGSSSQDKEIEPKPKRKFRLEWIGIALGIVLLGWFFVSYNTLVSKEEQVKTAWSQVESNLQRKIDLLPNLVAVVKKYASHEKEVFENVTKLRASASKTMNQARGKTNRENIQAMVGADDQLNKSMLTLFAVSENYPELRSSEQFLQLQAQIEGTENRINITRMQFNEAVGAFNGYTRKIPANIVSGIAGFQRKGYFRVERSVHKKYNVDM